jgi:hypothetical protein
MLTTHQGCSAFESACALPAGVIQGFETTSIEGFVRDDGSQTRAN